MQWFITGASSGIGRALAAAVLERGERVAATVRDASALDDLAARYGDALWTATLDVTDARAIPAVVARAFAAFGRIDVFTHNAGYGLFGAAEELSDEQIVRQLDTNLLGAIRVVRAALPHLRAQGGGRVLVVSSEGGQIAYPNFSVYHASKWGLEGFVEAVAREVAPLGIAFTIVEPGPTQTNFRSGVVVADAMDAYAATPSGDIRRAVASGDFPLTGDPHKVARAMIASAESSPAPMRLTLGTATFDRVRAALTERLAELGAQQAVAQSTELETSHPKRG